jgi:hypothetical protein
MTKNTIEITLDSDKTRAAEETSSALQSLEARLPSIREAALKGQMSAETLANWNDDIALARLRAEAAAHDADMERKGVADPAAVSEAVAAFHADEDLATDTLIAATEAVRSALEQLEQVNATRNAAVRGWVDKLRSLGIPDNGLSIGDDEISIQTSAIAGTTITIGSARTQAVSSVAPHIAHITQPYTQSAAQRIDPANLTRVDSRATTEAQRISVRLLHPLGPKKAGEILTRRTHSAGVLAHLVHNGHAELIEGEIPEPSNYERKMIPVDSRTRLASEWVTPSNVNDQAVVDRAVDKAFSN